MKRIMIGMVMLFASAGLFLGCGGGGSYIISGTITSGGSALSGVTVTLSGASSGTATTGSDGKYSFTVQNGSYTVTPSKTGYIFAPTSRAVTVSGANVAAQDFSGTATVYTYTISGTITYGGAALSGVTVTFTGTSSGTATTGSDGKYSFTVQNGSYTVTPSKTGYIFAPTSRAVTVSGANVTAQDFSGTATVYTYTISGTITYGGAALSGVTVTFTGTSSGTATTGSDGKYSFTVQNGSYTVTPSKTGYTFTPRNRAVTITNASSTANNFAATAAATTLLPKTGQTTSYSMGDDGALQKGVAWPNPRFTVGTGAEADCVTDNLTGLMWVKAPDSTRRTWQQALDYVANTTNSGGGSCGHTDWRMPNRKELRSLADYSQSNPALPSGHPFTNVQPFYYWSSTTYAGATDVAWFNDVYDGYVTADAKTVNGYVWTVRSVGAAFAAPADVPKTGQTTSYSTGDDGSLQIGVAWPNPRFLLAGSGTGTVVTDNLTGLMWAGDAGTPTFAGTTTCTGGALTWQGALDYVACLNVNNYLNHTDWRMPNINELESLVNAEQKNLATWLNTQGFSQVQASHYWSSTTYAGVIGYAWYVAMDVGTVGVDGETFNMYVWPVRSNQ